MFRSLFCTAAVLALASGCATISDGNRQQLLVQTIQDHREVFGAGCLLSNDVGTWFVTTPGRVTIQKSAGQLRVDCKKEGLGVAREAIRSKANGNIWGNLVLTAGIGYLVDRDTGAGYDYPSTLTIIMQQEGAAPSAAPAAAAIY